MATQIHNPSQIVALLVPHGRTSPELNSNCVLFTIEA